VQYIYVNLGQNAEAAGQGSCIVHALLAFVPFVGTYCVAKNREIIREYNDIDGSFAEDCLTSWCCGCCAIIQQSSVKKI